MDVIVQFGSDIVLYHEKGHLKHRRTSETNLRSSSAIKEQSTTLFHFQKVVAPELPLLKETKLRSLQSFNSNPWPFNDLRQHK